MALGLGRRLLRQPLPRRAGILDGIVHGMGPFYGEYRAGGVYPAQRHAGQSGSRPLYYPNRWKMPSQASRHMSTVTPVKTEKIFTSLQPPISKW